MYRLQIWSLGKWKWGIREYDTLEAANKRVKEFQDVGIKARVRLSKELFS